MRGYSFDAAWRAVSFFLLGTCAAGVPGFVHPPAASATPRTWIAGATVISPERPDTGRKLDVLIEGDRIAAVTAALPAGAERDAEIVDARGGVLIPGLIDGHVHLRSVPGMTAVMNYAHPLLVRAYRKQLPRSYLRYGYTTVVDLAVTDFGVLEDFAKAPDHPDLYHCGGPLPVPGGYPSIYAPALLRSRVFPNLVVDPKHPDNVPFGVDPKDHTPEMAVDRVKAAGGICVKTFYERGFGGMHDLPVPSAELLAEIARAAHGAGLPLLLHASSLEAQTLGLDAGANVFVHGMWNWGEFNDSQELPAPVREVLDRVIATHTGYQPTFQVLAGLRVLFDPDPFGDPGVRRIVPRALLDWYRSSDGQWFKKELSNGASDGAMRARFEAVLRRDAAVTAYLAKRGAFFLFGSDTPSGPTPGNLPGLNGYLEMRRLAGAGVSLRQVFEAATLNNAKAFGLADRLGTIEPGKRANLLLLERSPLASVEAYDTIRGIWIAGRHLLPQDLEARE